MMPVKTRIVLHVLALALVSLAGCGGGGESVGEDADQGDAPVDTSGGDVAQDNPSACEEDTDCSDGVYCNGQEVCSSGGECEAGTAVDCDDADGCTTDTCDEDGQQCAYEPRDEDADGFVDEACGGTEAS